MTEKTAPAFLAAVRWRAQAWLDATPVPSGGPALVMSFEPGRGRVQGAPVAARSAGDVDAGALARLLGPVAEAAAAACVARPLPEPDWGDIDGAACSVTIHGVPVRLMASAGHLSGTFLLTADAAIDGAPPADWAVARG